MIIDEYIEKGTEHPLCEDYAVYGYKPAPYMILTDGCSSSSDTDLGARILALSAQDIFKRYYKSIPKTSWGSMIFNNSVKVLQLLGINSIDSLFCTLIIAYIDESRLYVEIFGDGVLLLKYKNGYLTVRELEYTTNAPFYLVYKMNENLFYNYHQEHGTGKLFINRTDYDNTTTPVYSREQEWDYSSHYSKYFDISTIDFVAIGTDGITSFVTENKEPINKGEVYNRFMAFKNFNGEFVKRRVPNAIIDLKDEFNAHHYDDLSFIACKVL